MEFIEALEASLSWTLAPSTDHEEKVRVFCVPPEWSKWFYGRPFVQAHARVKSGGEDNSQAMAYAKIFSVEGRSLEFQGPWESPVKAQGRLSMLLENLSGPHVPSLDDLMILAGKCG